MTPSPRSLATLRQTKSFRDVVTGFFGLPDYPEMRNNNEQIRFLNNNSQSTFSQADEEGGFTPDRKQNHVDGARRRGRSRKKGKFSDGDPEPDFTY